jgi:hypothetical protein
MNVAVFLFLVFFLSGDGTTALTTPHHTGQDLWEVVNAHRKNSEVQELQLDRELCNNLVGCWTSISQGDNHEDLMAFLAKQGLVKDGQAVAPYKTIYELFAVKAVTAEKAVIGWTSSPGHKAALERAEFNVGCTYAEDGTGVLMMGWK